MLPETPNNPVPGTAQKLASTLFRENWGGMAYQAVDLAIERRVAIKTVSACWQRKMREAETMMQRQARAQAAGA
jgi:ribonuclease I